MKNITLSLLLFVSAGLFAAKGTETIKYNIQPKETIFRIALMYNSTVKDIIDANPGLSPQRIHDGMTINVPRNTQMRDAALVESLLNGKHDGNTATANEVKKAPQQVKKETEQTQVSSPAHIDVKVEKPVEEKPVIKENEVPASTPIQAAKVGSPTENKPLTRQSRTTPSSAAMEIQVDYPASANPVANIVYKAVKDIPTEYPVSKEAPAKENISATPNQVQGGDENPFVVPSEPKSVPAVKGQPVKQEMMANPASADKGQEAEDENPFMTPRHKADANKLVDKSNAGTSSTE